MILVNGERVNYSKWGGGEIKFKLPYISSGGRSVEIFALIQSSDDIMALAMITDAVKRLDIGDVVLLMPYFPYGRQDRIFAGEALGAKVMAGIINSMGFSSVIIDHPHSYVTENLIDNVIVKKSISKHVAHRISSLSSKGDSPILVAPDAGASKLVEELAKSSNCRYTVAMKSRVDGSPKFIGLVGPDAVKDGDVVIVVDDICDGGRTFVELIKGMRENLPGIEFSAELIVTHGIFSRGKDELNQHFSKITAVHDWTRNQGETL